MIKEKKDLKSFKQIRNAISWVENPVTGKTALKIVYLENDQRTGIAWEKDWSSPRELRKLRNEFASYIKQEVFK